MDEVFINALVNRIKAETGMTVEQVPIPYQDEVRERLEENKIEGDKE